ncbi:DUF6057 family protein [uncultured Bacteroides sp.]|uniref:DUF6057 family protein n=1 Tax=uncultured Bacteroides sp. TaxID=162156 RepID=UPI002AAB58D4|nr:DUF6057 family protein [uncultured Bacteroides sp.]
MYSYNSHSEKKAARTISLVSGLLFIIFSFVYLSVNFRYLLSTTEDFSLFVNNSSFFLGKISQPGGVLLYLAGFFTQYLHSPSLGALIITILLLIIQRLTYKSFDFNKKYFILSYIPSFLLLVIITNVGRSIYLMPHAESIFTYILGILFILLSYFFSQKIQDSSKSIITVCWLFPLLFFVLSGSYTIYFLGIILLCRPSSINNRDKTPILLICTGLYLFLFLLIKFILFPNSTGYQALFGTCPAIPAGQSGVSILPHLLLIFFFCFVAIKQHFMPLGNRIKSYTRWTYTNILWLVVLCVITASMANTNDCFRDEMAIDHSIQNRDFKPALLVGKDVQHPTREMTVLRNFALELSGKAADKMFEYPQDYKTDGLFLDYDKEGISYPVGPMIYFNLGAKHLASEWADNDYQKNPHSFRMLKNYVLIATVNGHFNVTKKIAGILDKTSFHSDFAKELNDITLDHSLVNKDSVLGDIKKRLSDKYYAFPAKGDYAKFICNFYRDNIDNKVAYDYYMMSALLNKNLDKFAWGVKLYKVLYKTPLPKHYDEAAALCNYLNKETLYVNPSTQQKFKEFLKLKKQQKNPNTENNIMRRSYGETYWWYYMYK